MAFLAQTDAIIIDVRYAPGGDVRMVDMLASYFFDKVTPTLATYSRSRERDHPAHDARERARQAAARTSRSTC